MEILFFLAGICVSFLAAAILNRMPAKCFCDYDETPDAHHQPPRIGKWGRIISGAVMAGGFAALQMRFGFSLTGCCLCLFCAVLMMIALSDTRYSIIPDELIIAACVLAVIARAPDAFSGDFSPVFGALLGGGIILAINLLGRLLYKKDTLGMGDLKLMAVCGIACGTGGILVALLSGILIAAVFFAVAIALKRTQSDAYLPLGPFLVAGVIFTLCCQPLVDSALAWYISLI